MRERRYRRIDEHIATLPHDGRQGRTNSVENTKHIDLDTALPSFGVNVGDRPKSSNACVGKDDVDAAQLGQGFFNKVLHRLQLRDIGHPVKRLRAAALGHLRQGFCIAVHQNRNAAMGQYFKGSGCANARSCTGN